MINIPNQHNQPILTRSLIFLGRLWVLPVIYYFYTLGRFVVNTPFGDDVDLIIGNTAFFLDAPDLQSALPYLFKQSAEYRATFIALSGIISTKLLGYINFSAITLVGNLTLFAGVFIVVLMAAKNSKEFGIFALLSFLLLGAPVYADCAVWTNCTIGHFGSIFIAAVMSLLLIRSGIVFFILFEISLVTFAHLHGSLLAMIPLGILGIWLFQPNQTKKYLIVSHLIISASLLIVWQITFDSAVAGQINEAMNLGLQQPAYSILAIIQWILGWMGSWSSFEDSLLTAMIVGSIEIIFIVYLCVCYRKFIINRYPHLTLMIIYLFMIILVSSITRSYGVVDPQSLFTDRFKVYSLVLAICLMLIFLALIRDKIDVHNIFQPYVLFAVLVACLFYSIKVNSDKQTYFVSNKNQRLHCARLWTESGQAKPCMWHGDNKLLMDKAVQMGILYIDGNGSEPVRCEEPYLKYCWK